MPDSSEISSPAKPTTSGGNEAYRARYSALANSQRRISGIVEQLSSDDLDSPSYCSEWSIAQVLSHLGSGAEIFSLIVAAGLKGDPAPGREEFEPVWDRWNAKNSGEQARDLPRVDAALLEQLDALDDAQRAAWHLSLFGQDQDLSDILRLRLGEHAVHTWDVAVTRDADATISPDAVDLMIDVLGPTASRSAKPSEQPLQIKIVTHSPERVFDLHVNNDGTVLQAVADNGNGDTSPTLESPAEGFIRLVYGRLDPAHTPKVSTEGVEIDDLRHVFPGF